MSDINDSIPSLSKKPITKGVTMIMDKADQELTNSTKNLYTKINTLKTKAEKLTEDQINAIKTEIMEEVAKIYARVQLKAMGVKEVLESKKKELGPIQETIENLIKLPEEGEAISKVMSYVSNLISFFEKVKSNFYTVSLDIGTAIEVAGEKGNQIYKKLSSLESDIQSALDEVKSRKG